MKANVRNGHSFLCGKAVYRTAKLYSPPSENILSCVETKEAGPVYL